MAVFSACAFGFVGICFKKLANSGMSVASILTFRFLISAVFSAASFRFSQATSGFNPKTFGSYHTWSSRLRTCFVVIFFEHGPNVYRNCKSPFVSKPTGRLYDIDCS